jgi:DNA-binding Lrp family transcriptional regulator
MIVPSANVFISCELGCETAVIDELRTLDQVIEADRVYDPSYDIITKVKADTTDKLKETINRSIRRIEKGR